MPLTSEPKIKSGRQGEGSVRVTVQPVRNQRNVSGQNRTGLGKANHSGKQDSGRRGGY